MTTLGIRAKLDENARLLTRIMRDLPVCTGKQLAYLSLETPGIVLKAAAEQGDLGEQSSTFLHYSFQNAHALSSWMGLMSAIHPQEHQTRMGTALSVRIVCIMPI